MNLVLVRLPDALPSCLQSWIDLFDYANRLAVRRGGPGAFAVTTWTPGEPTPPADAVLVPARIAQGDRGTDLAVASAELRGALVAWHRAGTLVAGVCAGVFCLADAGLLDGRRATTHWSLAEAFQRRFPLVSLEIEALVLESDDLLLGGGMTAYFDVGLRLVRRFAGDLVARDCAAVFVLDPERRYQSPFAPAGLGPTDADPVLARAVDWATDQRELNFGVEQWAEAIAVEKRTLERRARAAWGMGPAERLRSLKLDRARLLLGGGHLSWDEVSQRCGYQDAGAFRRLFLQRFGQTPGEYRRRFGTGRAVG